MAINININDKYGKNAKKYFIIGIIEWEKTLCISANISYN